jgi:hypothetical protein
VVCTCISRTCGNNNCVQTFMNTNTQCGTCATWCCVCFIVRPTITGSTFNTWVSIYTNACYGYAYIGALATCGCCHYGDSFSFYFRRGDNTFRVNYGTFGGPSANTSITLY